MYEPLPEEAPKEGLGFRKFLRKIFKGLYDVVETLVIAGAIVIFVYLFIASPHEVLGRSMEENFFDVITMWHVIEHVKNPLQVLKKVYNLLRPGAVVFVATPNLDKRVAKIAYRLKSNKPYPFYSPEGEQHLFHFTESTLKKIIKKAGFNIVYSGVDFASVRLEFKTLECASFILSTIFHRNWNENILVIAQK